MTDPASPNATLGALLASAEQQLTAADLAYGHGTTNAHDEAAWLVLWSLGLPLDIDLGDASWFKRPLTQQQQAQAASLLKARIQQRQPAAYLTRQAWLQGVPFYVDERTIIPRSLIAEVLASGGIDAWLGSAGPRRVLDLCTGGGSLAVLAALAWPGARIDAADLSADALAVAQINIDQHHLHQRIRLIQSDGLAACPGPYDLILCNPPYVNAQSMSALPPEYRAEPELALSGGPDGMDFIRPLLAAASAHLADSGVLILEIGHERQHFEAAFPRLNPVWLDTSAGGDQVLLATRDMLRATSASSQK